MIISPLPPCLWYVGMCTCVQVHTFVSVHVVCALIFFNEFIACICVWGGSSLGEGIIPQLLPTSFSEKQSLNGLELTKFTSGCLVRKLHGSTCLCVLNAGIL